MLGRCCARSDRWKHWLKKSFTEVARSTAGVLPGSHFRRPFTKLNTLILALAFASFAAQASQTIGLKFLGGGSVDGVLVQASRVTVLGNRAAVATGANGLQLFDVSNPARPVKLGASSATAWDVRLTNNLACVASGYDGLTVFDLSNPSLPVRLGGYRPSGDGRSLVLSGPDVYLADGSGGLQVIDVSNPSSLWLAGRYPRSLMDSLTALDVRVAGAYAYIAAGNEGLDIFRVDYLDSIPLTGHLALGATATALDLSGSTACVLGDNGKVNFISVSDPRNPALLGQYPKTMVNGLQFSGLKVTGSLVYLAAESNGAQVVDFSDPANPMQVGGFDTFGQTKGIALANGLVYLADGSAGLVILQPVTNGVALPVIASGPEDQTIAQGTTAAFEVAVTATTPVTCQWLFDGTPILGATQAVLRVPNVDKPQAGSYVAVVSTDGGSIMSKTATLTPVFPPQITVQPGNRLLVESNTATFSVTAGPVGPLAYQWRWNTQPIAGATQPSLVLSNVSLSQAGSYSVLVSNIAGVALSSNATLVVKPRVSLRQVAHWPQTPDASYANNVRVVGNLAFLAYGSSGVYALDVTDPANPTQVGWVPSRGYSASVEVVGTTAYIADGLNGGLSIVDVSNLASPQRLASFTTQTAVNDVRVAGSRAYVAAGEGGLLILDVSNPAQPAYLAHTGSWDTALSVEVSGNYAYVADRLGGCAIYDVSNPAQPVEAARVYDYSLSVRGVRVVGSRAYLASAYDGLDLYDISNPAAPVPLAFYDSPSYGLGVRVTDGYAYLADDRSGMQVLDLSTPSTLLEVGGWDTPGAASGVDVAGDYVFVADGTNGLVILEASRNGAAPQPFRLTSQWVQADHSLRLQVSVDGPGTLQLQGSSNLTHWTTLATTNAPTGISPVEFTATPDPAHPVRFYRAVKNP